jgi:hypothetical protein
MWLASTDSVKVAITGLSGPIYKLAVIICFSRLRMPSRYKFLIITAATRKCSVRKIQDWDFRCTTNRDKGYKRTKHRMNIKSG